MKLSEIISWVLNILLISVVIILSFKLQVPKYESTKPTVVTETVTKEIKVPYKVKVPVAITDTIFIGNNIPVTVVSSDTTVVDKDGNSVVVSYFYPPYNFFDVQTDIKTKEIINIVYQDKEVIRYIPEPINGWKRIRPSIQVGGGITFTDKTKLGWYLGAGISYILW